MVKVRSVPLISYGLFAATPLRGVKFFPSVELQPDEKAGMRLLVVVELLVLLWVGVVEVAAGVTV